MAFNTWKDFKKFEAAVKREYRFIHSPEVKEFLDNIKETLHDRTISLARGTIFFRSQIGYETFVAKGQIGACGFPSERMKPKPNNSHEGRANPKGISYLYLSDDVNTCLAESRPHKGQIISWAQFRINRDLRIVDCCTVPSHDSEMPFIFNPPQSQEDIGDAIWSRINSAFTKPITNNDAHSDYVPTQILAELFKSSSLDGIRFKSGVGEGHNFLLFDVDSADFINSAVLETKAISYEFSAFTDHYSLQEKLT